jgi:hypothetical protein
VDLPEVREVGTRPEIAEKPRLVVAVAVLDDVGVDHFIEIARTGVTAMDK